MNRRDPRTHFVLQTSTVESPWAHSCSQLQLCADRQRLEPLEAKASPWEQADSIPGLRGSQRSSLLFLPGQTADFPPHLLGKVEVL